MRPIFTEVVTKVKPNTNSVEVHPQLSNIRHPVDDVLVGASSLCPKCSICEQMGLEGVLYAKNTVPFMLLILLASFKVKNSRPNNVSSWLRFLKMK
jgi:hypothetical protein